MVSDSAQGRAPSQKPPKNRTADADAGYVTPAEQKLAEQAGAALQWARLRAREGETVFRVKHLAARFGWAYSKAAAAVECLERAGTVQGVARRGRDEWALTGTATRR